jgi:hypothetical protein
METRMKIIALLAIYLTIITGGCVSKPPAYPPFTPLAPYPYPIETSAENTEWNTGTPDSFDMDEQEPVFLSDAPDDSYTSDDVKTIISEMPRVNALQPVYHLLILDRLYSPLNSDISGTDNISILYKFRHGRNGYLVALYKSTAGGPVFPKLPDKSRVLVDLMTVRVNTIREYVRSSAFRQFVTNRRVVSGMNAALRRERSGGFQGIASDAITNEMSRLNASQPVYHLLILDRNPLNSDISDTRNIKVLYKYKHGRNGYLIALYKSAAGGPVFPQLPDKSRVMVNLTTVRVSALRGYIRTGAFRRFVTNRRIISGMDAALRRELK